MFVGYARENSLHRNWLKAQLRRGKIKSNTIIKERETITKLIDVMDSFKLPGTYLNKKENAQSQNNKELV